MPTRDEIADQYFEQLPYPPYPVQEEAMLSWFASDAGVLVCAPTGMGKTLIAHAALFEALHTRTMAYYTTPLIALTEQKFVEMQHAAIRWGFDPNEIGLVTGNRKVNPDARILIVVAEILLNRLLHPDDGSFENVSAVVMDEFHSFADAERGIVWELTLAMLPSNVRLLLLSATVGNANEFVNWLDRCHGRKVELVEGTERKVPLTYEWVPDKFLNELIVEISKGDDSVRRTPALVFCFNRDECWNVAEELKGLDVMYPGQKAALNAIVDTFEWPNGVGPRLKQLLRRGVGIHHAGLLPHYRRAIEDLFEKKLLSVAVCTETLAAGINLPARSVVLSSLVKGPFGKEKLIEASTAHQIFGRAGRPQFDKEGFVYAVPHEDDVRLLRWKEKYDQIPEDTKDPGLMKKKKELKKKKPDRSPTRQYWTQAMFDKLKVAPPGKLYSKGPLPWRLLGWLLQASPEVDRVRTVLRKRLMDESRIVAGQKVLDTMLVTLHDAGFVVLDPPPPPPAADGSKVPYSAVLATPTSNLTRMMAFRSVHPIYATFLIDQLGTANRDERLQAFESILEIPRPLLKFVRVPFDLPPGPLQTTRLDIELQQRGLIVSKPPLEEGEEEPETDAFTRRYEERPPVFAEKLKLLFDSLRPDVTDVTISAAWAAGEILNYGGNFNLFVQQRDIVRQEGIIFRHLLRLLLLCEEFMEVVPADTTEEEWRGDLGEIVARLTETCRVVDPTSTEETIQRAQVKDVLKEGESAAVVVVVVPGELPAVEAGFGAGLFDD